MVIVGNCLATRGECVEMRGCQPSSPRTKTVFPSVRFCEPKPTFLKEGLRIANKLFPRHLSLDSISHNLQF